MFQTIKSNKSSTLVGKTIKHTWTKGKWAGSSYTTLFCSKDTLVWNNTTDPEHIVSERETYIRTDITDGIVQISWREDPAYTNYGLVWTLDFNQMKIYGVIVNAIAVENIVVEGSFEVKNSLEVEAHLLGCTV